MSPIIDLQRRLAPAGRIRIGEQVPSSNGKTRPKKLTTFRFTSSTKRHIDGVARLYGGEPQPWQDAPTEGQWELYTPASEIPIVVPPERMSFSQWYELWSGGGCQRRCDGAQLESGGECICDPAARECDIHTRLSVMLSDLPGIGLWRLDTKGYYAGTELGGSFEIAELLVSSLGRSVLPGLLRLEERVVKRNGQTFKFVVPVLDFDVDMSALALGRPAAPALAASSRPALPEGEAPDPDAGDGASPSGLRPIPRDETPPPSVTEQIAAVGAPAEKKKRANAAPPIPATGRAPRPAAEAEKDDAAPPPRPAVSDTDRDAAVERAKERTRKAQETTTKAPAKKAATAKKAAPRADAAPPVERSTHLDNGEVRITPPMVKAIQTGFSKLDVQYTREQRLRYVRNVLRDDAIETTWDLSVGQASELIDHLKIVNGDEPPPREDENG